MPRSHICPRCGKDLARTRASVDALYRLPLVTCPQCRWTAVRRRHPVERFWRTTRRRMLAAFSLGLHLAVSALVLLVLTGFCMAMAAMADDDGIPVLAVPAALLRELRAESHRGNVATGLTVLFTLLSLTGICIGLGLRHHRRWFKYTVVYAAAATVLAIPLVYEIGRWLLELRGAPITSALERNWDQLSDAFVASVFLPVVLAPSVIVGELLGRTADRRRSARYRAFVKRVRKRRIA